MSHIAPNITCREWLYMHIIMHDASLVEATVELLQS